MRLIVCLFVGRYDMKYSHSFFFDFSFFSQPIIWCSTYSTVVEKIMILCIVVFFATMVCWCHVWGCWECAAQVQDAIRQGGN